MVLRDEEARWIKPGECWILSDVDEFARENRVDVGRLEGEMLGIVHQTPRSHLEAASGGSGTIETSIEELAAWVGIGDDFVEYIDLRVGGMGGVFYQCPPMNDGRLGTTWVTVCQSPKVLFAARVEPFLLLLNVSSDHSYRRVGQMRLTLFGQSGERIGRGEVRVPPFGSRVVPLRSMLAALAYRGNAMLLGISTMCTLVPFGLLRDDESGMLAVDHTMPPGNYHSAWADKGRRLAWAADLQGRWDEGRL
jgi:hypothetical protein